MSPCSHTEPHFLNSIEPTRDEAWNYAYCTCTMICFIDRLYFVANYALFISGWTCEIKLLAVTAPILLITITRIQTEDSLALIKD
jgi:hypothetical protein